MKIKNLYKLFILLFLVFNNCNGKIDRSETDKKEENLQFNFNGRKVLYMDEVDANNNQENLILFNLDTNEKLTFTNFNEVKRNSYLLFNNGKSIFMKNYMDDIGIYDVLTSKVKKLGNQPGVVAESIYNDTLYLAKGNKITSYTLPDFKKIREYETDSDIHTFAVYSNQKIAVVHVNYSLSTVEVSFYDYSDENRRKTNVPDAKYVMMWSEDRKYLLLNNSTLLKYPSLEIQPLSGLENESLEVIGFDFLIDNETIIFTGSKVGEDFDNLGYPKMTNLFLYDIKTDKILKQLTKSNSRKFIKSVLN